jgi:hypothetical protein
LAHEVVGNLHIHTPYSDGEWYHAQIAQAASQAGLDFVVVTDHNVWVAGPEGYHSGVLTLIGEEVHHARCYPQVNHLLVYGAEAELSQCAFDPQRLIDAARAQGGLAFIAHPFDYALHFAHEPGIPWVDWEVDGYHGLEIWNYMSEFKTRLPNRLLAVLYAFKPQWAIRGPFKNTLRVWDELLASGRRVAGVGNADAHGTPMSLGPIKRVVFPYEYLFRCVNTHLVLDEALTRDVEYDKQLIYSALGMGYGWVGYDLIGSTKGFRFAAHSASEYAEIGRQIRRVGAVNFEVDTPLEATIQIVKAGKGVVARASRKRGLKFTSVEAGAYRVEAYRSGKGWIFSNPIYVL